MKKSGIEKAVLDRNKTLKQPVTLDNGAFRKVVLTLRAINHEERLQILSLLKQNKEMSVTELFTALNSEQSVISQHLAVLRRAGMVNSSRSGKHIYYSVNKERFDEINQFIEALN
jgi:ArsR family transcriptional regulator, virulence genes transcriptional regulator